MSIRWINRLRSGWMHGNRRSAACSFPVIESGNKTKRWNRRVSITLLIGLCPIAADAGSASFWTEQSLPKEFAPIVQFMTVLNVLPVDATVRSCDVVEKAIALCTGAEQLLQNSKTNTALRIVVANETILRDGAELVSAYSRCSRVAETILQLKEVTSNSEEYSSVLSSADIAEALMRSERYQEAEKVYQDAMDSFAEIASQQVAEAIIRGKSDEGINLWRLGGKTGDALHKALQQLESTTPSTPLLERIKGARQVAALWAPAMDAATKMKERIQADMSRIQGYQPLLNYLDQYLKEDPAPPYVIRLKKEVLANWRFKPGQTLLTNQGLNLVYIPPGTFAMGSMSDEAGRDSNETLHSVTISKGFFIGAFEITQQQWDRVMGTGANQSPTAHFPKERVNWEQANSFCRKLSGLEPGRVYRLPTEAEWEYACRAERRTPFNHGKSTLLPTEAAIFDLKNPLQSATVIGCFQPNSWGLYDMHGNLAEWCQDWMGDYPTEKTVDPTGPTDAEVDPDSCGRVIRGGSWVDDPIAARSACRQSQLPVIASESVGFRVVLEADFMD